MLSGHVSDEIYGLPGISSLLNEFLESTIKAHNLTCRYILALRSFEASFYMHHCIMHSDTPVASEDESTKKVFGALRSQHCHCQNPEPNNGSN